MITKISVTIVGATGETGRNILEGLLEAKDQFVIDADMASNSAPCVQREGRLKLKKTGNHRTFRPASVNKSAYSPLKDRGIKVVAAELTGPEEELVEVLSNVDVLIASLPVAHIKDQIRLARAAKKAGIKRFVPTAFAMIAPPKGVVDVQDIKEDVLNAVKALNLPYTVINIGWWYTGFRYSSPRLRPHRLSQHWWSRREANIIPGDGIAISCMTDPRDTGRFTARIISDPRTLDKEVLCYDWALTLNELLAEMEKISEEKI